MSTISPTFYSFAQNGTTPTNSGTSTNWISGLSSTTATTANFTVGSNALTVTYGIPAQGGRIPIPTIQGRSNPPRDFNRYLNASDMLEEFIRFCGRLGVSQAEMMSLPVELFANFLVTEAAKEDGEDPPEEAEVRRPQYRCLSCGQYIPRKMGIAGFNYCSPAHAGLHVARIAA